jgi:hypothetical protein
MKFSAKFKAMKAFKTFKILLIIILSIVLIVSLLKYFNLYTEGFSSNEELADYDLKQIESEPVCEANNTDSETAVPACYATVQPNRGNDYLHFDDSDYILKTQIETPVCPNNPTEYGNNGLGSLISENNHIETPDDSWLKSGNINTDSNTPSNDTPVTSDSTPSTLESPYIIQPDIALNSPQNNSTGLNDLNLNFPTLNMTPEPSKTDGNNNTPKSEPTTVRDDKCPPCPACQRCPEPVVECKKVVNYTNAASSGQLPVPYINDFSKF